MYVHNHLPIYITIKVDIYLESSPLFLQVENNLIKMYNFTFYCIILNLCLMSLMCSSVSSVLQCGRFSNPFLIGRGCRQGAPIAPQLFILSAQILTLMINAKENIRGIIIDDEEFKLTQFADDTTLILNGTIASLRPSLILLKFTFTEVYLD